MRKLVHLVFLCFTTIGVYAQNKAVQSGPISSPGHNTWTPGTLWILICAAFITGFIFLVLYAISGATISLAEQVENMNEK